MQWSIPQPSGHALPVELEPGRLIFVVGPNGSGKSALLQHLAASSGDRIRRIFAHRQTWLPSGSLTLTPESRRQFERNRRDYETAPRLPLERPHGSGDPSRCPLRPRGRREQAGPLDHGVC